MRIILVSDSHGNRSGVERLIENENFDYLFFMGDGLNDFGLYENLENVIMVSGNCDFLSVVANERIFYINDISIFVTHGNKYNVKSGLNKLREKAESEGVDFVFFGHTHRPTVELINNIYYINPGSFARNSSGESRCMELIINGKDTKIAPLII